MSTKRIRRFGTFGLGAAVLLAAISGAASARDSGSGLVASSTQADATIVSQWNAIAQAETVLLRPTAHGQMRGIAMVQGAVYDAVNAIDRSRKGYLLDAAKVGIGRRASLDAAAATAAYRVLLAITPESRHAGLGTAYQGTLAAIPEGPREQGGIRAGEAAATAMLAARQNDGFMATFSPNIGSEAGKWRPIGWPTTPAYDPDGWVGSLKPFLIRSAAEFRSKGPNALTSAAYAEDFAEVKALGALASPTRTADQTAAAVFWQFAPIALWNPVARELATRFELDTADEARLYASVNLAGTDAAIACWNDKYHWNFWRPRAAIREADTDGNPATTGDPSWESLFAAATQTTPPLGTPPFPDHPSGHGCLSGAVLQTMADFFGRDKVVFTVPSGRSLNGVPIPARRFQSFSQTRQEIIDARVWGGIHFRTADRQGAVLGRKVARYIRKSYFRPVR
jgi:PAP2 superfamily